MRDINFIISNLKRFFPKFDDAGLLKEINECARIQTGNRFLSSLEWLLIFQLDYLLQGSNARYLSDLFQGDNRVKIPKQYRRYSKDQSLVVEFCKGFQLSETDGITALGYSKKQVISTLLGLFRSLILILGPRYPQDRSFQNTQNPRSYVYHLLIPVAYIPFFF